MTKNERYWRIQWEIAVTDVKLATLMDSQNKPT